MFKIIYLEDEVGYAKRIEDAVAHYNRQNAAKQQRPLAIKSIRSPSQLMAELNQQYDLVLADVFYPNNEGEQVSRLSEIVAAVKKWSEQHNLGKALPIIAYTGQDGEELEVCLQNKDDLYDIWDKSSATPTYAAWRLAQLALELSRTRPDALLERLIRTMDKGATWHSLVVEMAKKYGSGWNEADQISKAGESIRDIAFKLGVREYATRSWEVMEAWEPLGCAASSKVRGHARHVINVYWLGYYLLHHPDLENFFSKAWKHVLADRGGMTSVKKEDAITSLSNCWFYSGLFHDVAQVVEKYSNVETKTGEIFGTFKELISHTPGACASMSDLVSGAAKLFEKLGEPLRAILTPVWENGVKKGKLDHGVVAGVHLLNSIHDERQLCFAREAARAMAIHNLIGSIGSSQSPFLSWEHEPITCLLLLCDQIQTWDRDRNDPKGIDEDQPEKAALSELKIEAGPSIELWIEYSAPRHLDHAPVVFERLKTKLKTVLQTKPTPVLDFIKKPWPFSTKIEFRLNGESLDSKFEVL